MMHGVEKSVKDRDLVELAGQYCFSLIAEYVPKHSGCSLENCKGADVHPARSRIQEGRNPFGKALEAVRAAFLGHVFPFCAHVGGKSPGRLLSCRRGRLRALLQVGKVQPSEVGKKGVTVNNSAPRSWLLGSFVPSTL